VGRIRRSGESGTERHASFPRVMTDIVLAAVGFLACAFYILVLFQWTVDTKRKTATRSAEDDVAGETSAKKRPQLVASLKTPEEQDRFSGKSRSIQGMGERSRICGPGCNECERIAHEKVAWSLRSGKRT
jgi:hypothetical protein